MHNGHADPLSAVAAAAAAIGRLPASPAAGSMHQSGSEANVHTGFSHATLEELRAASERFAVEREWEKFHAPRNLVLALVSPFSYLVLIDLLYDALVASIDFTHPAEAEALPHEGASAPVPVSP